MRFSEARGEMRTQTEAGHSLMMLSALSAGEAGARRRAERPEMMRSPDGVGGLAAAVRYCVAEEATRERRLTQEEAARLASLRDLAAAAGLPRPPRASTTPHGMPPPAASERVSSSSTTTTPHKERSPSFHPSGGGGGGGGGKKAAAEQQQQAPKGQRFLRPSELFANDFRARVRAEHPGFLDRAVRSKLSEMWRDVDPATRAEYVEKARLEREKARARQQSKPAPRASSSLTTQQLARGDAVCLVDDPSKKGVVTGKTTSWVLVNFFGECDAPKERPWRLQRASHASGGATPFEIVSSAQATLDSRVQGNRFRDRDGGWRRQLVAVLRGRADVAATCDACSLHSSFSGHNTFRLADVAAHVREASHLEALSKLAAAVPAEKRRRRRAPQRCGRCGPCRAKKGAPCLQATGSDDEDDDDSSTLGWVASVPALERAEYRVETSELFERCDDDGSRRRRRQELSSAEKERALAMLGAQQNMRAVAAALDRPLADLLAWYYKECDDDDEAAEAWLPSSTRSSGRPSSKRRHSDTDGSVEEAADAPASYPVVADLWASLDAASTETPDHWAVEGRPPRAVEPPADDVETAASAAKTPPKQRMTAVAGPEGALSLRYEGEDVPFAYDGRSWLLCGTSRTSDVVLETTAADYMLDPVQLAHAQKLIEPAACAAKLVLLPTAPTRAPPSLPSERDAARLDCLGGELLEVGSATYGSRLWYCPRASETLEDVGAALSSLELPPTGNKQQLTASELSGFGSDARTAPQAVFCASRPRAAAAARPPQEAADLLWLEQLQYCDGSDAWARAVPRREPLLPLLPRRLSRRLPLLLVPDVARCFPQPRRRPSRRDASSSDDEDASFSARRSRVLCIVPPPRPLGAAAAPRRRWARRQDALAVFRRLSSKPGEDVLALAAALDCDPVGLARRNVAPSPYLLLPSHDLLAPCTQCRVLGERRKFGCRVVRRHATAPPYFHPATALLRVRRRQDDLVCWFFATRANGELRYEFPRSYRPMRSRLAEPDDDSDDVCVVHAPPDFDAVARRCEALVDRTFRFRKSPDVWLVTDAFYSLREGVDALVCEYVNLNAATSPPATCTLAHLQATADWLNKPRNDDDDDDDDDNRPATVLDDDDDTPMPPA